MKYITTSAMGGIVNVLSGSIFFGLEKNHRKKVEPGSLFLFYSDLCVYICSVFSWHLLCVFMVSVLLKTCISVATALRTTRTLLNGVFTQNGIELNRMKQFHSILRCCSVEVFYKTK